MKMIREKKKSDIKLHFISYFEVSEIDYRSGVYSYRSFGRHTLGYYMGKAIT